MQLALQGANHLQPRFVREAAKKIFLNGKATKRGGGGRPGH